MVNNFKVLVDLQSKSLRQINREVMISLSTLSLYYAGKRTPKGKFAEKLAEYFDVPSEIFSSEIRIEGKPATVINHVPEIIEKSKLTMAEISRGSGIPYNSIYQYVKNKSIPRDDKLRQLSDYFKIPETDLVEVRKASYSYKDNKDKLSIQKDKSSNVKPLKNKNNSLATVVLPSISVDLPNFYLEAIVANITDNILTQLEKSFNDNELYKPMVRMSGLCRWLDVSTTTVIKWQKEGMPHMVIDGVTLYDKHKVAKWLEQFRR